MSEHTRPQPTGLHSHATAAIGVRTHRLVGRGADYAKLLWLVLLSHSRWPGNSARPVWACDLTLIHEMGLFARDVREAKRGLQRLADAGMIKRSIGHRPGARRPVGRVIEPALGSQVRVLIPDRHEMAQLWARCRAFRSRPCSAAMTSRSEKRPSTRVSRPSLSATSGAPAAIAVGSRSMAITEAPVARMARV